MAQKIILAQMKQRRDTNARWESVNPVLAEGEIGVITDKPGYFKIGNGADAWNDLPMAGGGAASGMVNVTYDELVELRGNKKLIPGSKYRIIDYETHVNHSLLAGTDVKFDVVVIALSEDTLSESAGAMYPLRRNPGSGNISKSHFEGWRLGYRLDNDTDEFSWAYENGRGVIYHMVDEWENEAFFDFKSLMIAHDDGNFYFTFGGSVDRSSIGTMQGNYIGPESMFNIIISSYGSCRIGTMSSSNFINGQRVTIGDYSRANNIEGDDVTLAGNCSYNNIKGSIITLGSNSHENTLTGDQIRLGHACNANQISADNVEFSDFCVNNRLESLCSFIKFGMRCIGNRIVQSNHVTIGNETTWSIVQMANKTKIGARCSGIELYYGEGNEIGDDCTNVSLQRAFKEDGATVNAECTYNQIGVRNMDINLIGAQNTVIGNDNTEVQVGGREDGVFIAAKAVANRIGSNNSTVRIYSGCSRNVVEDNVNFVVIGNPLNTVTSDETRYIQRDSNGNYVGAVSRYIQIGIETAYNRICSESTTLNHECTANIIDGGAVITGIGCSGNRIAKASHSLTLGDSCYNNVFHPGSNVITLGNNCQSNSFGPDCYNIHMKDNCNGNDFGPRCTNIFTGAKHSLNTYMPFCKHNFVTESDTSVARDNVRCCVIHGNYDSRAYKFKCSDSSGYIQNFIIHDVVGLPSTALPVNKETTTIIASDSQGVTKYVSLGDLAG